MCVFEGGCPHRLLTYVHKYIMVYLRFFAPQEKNQNYVQPCYAVIMFHCMFLCGMFTSGGHKAMDMGFIGHGHFVGLYVHHIFYHITHASQPALHAMHIHSHHKKCLHAAFV